LIGSIAFCQLGALLVFADDKDDAQYSERSIKQADVPASALAGLKKLGGKIRAESPTTPRSTPAGSAHLFRPDEVGTALA